MEDQAVEVVGEVREDEFGFGAGQTDCSDEQTEAVFLVCEGVVFPLPPFRAIAAITTRLSFGMMSVLSH